MLYEYLIDHYKMNEPIFISDINLQISNVNLRQMFKCLCDSGKIKRYDQGIYYIPGKSRIKGASPFAPEKAAQYKYIMRNGDVKGYYSGCTFANQIGLITQVPVMHEIVSNQASAISREVCLKGQRFLLRRPRTTVTTENFRILQLLDLLNDFKRYVDDGDDAATERVKQYMKNENITQDRFDKYISIYPDKVYKNVYEMRLYNVFA